VPIDLPRTGPGEAPDDGDSRIGLGVIVSPDGIIGRELVVDVRRLGFEGA
jgi:hypothetical protein